MTLSDRLQELRKTHNLSQELLAEKSDILRQAISKRGKAPFCTTLCQRCRKNAVADGKGNGILKRQESGQGVYGKLRLM